jgi:hypothetical protein
MQKFHELIDKAIIDKYKPQVRDYLGASIIGHVCSRKIQYQYKNTVPDELPEARRLRTLQRGNIFEKVMLNWLIDAGFQIQGIDPIIGFIGNQFGGHIDGLITGGPEIEGMKYPFIWENKAVGEKTFNSLSKHGLENNPVYQAQVALYQAYLNFLNPALFTVINCNTMEIYTEMIPFNAGIAQEMSDKAARIIEDTGQGIDMPRISDDPEYFECRWCEYRQRCWDIA